MDVNPVPGPVRTGSTLRAIAFGGIACGVFDYVFAYLYYKQATWSGIGRSVARGVLDQETVDTGAAWIVPLGITLHFAISIGAAAMFVAVFRRLVWVRRYPAPAGLLYGVIVYLVMNWFIAPLAFAGRISFAVDWGSLAGHMVVVGLPISLAAHWVGLRSDR